MTAEIGASGNVSPGLQGSVTVKALNNTDAKANADASTVSKTQVNEKGVGVAAAVNYVDPDSIARVAGGARLDTIGLTVMAGVNSVPSTDMGGSPDMLNIFEATARSGAARSPGHPRERP